MWKTLQESYYFTRHQFQPLLLIALVYAVPSYFIDVYVLGQGEDIDQNYLGLMVAVSLVLKILQFAAAMLYIDGLSHNRPISIVDAYGGAFQKLFYLMTLNILRAAMVSVGLILLVVPGLFLLYKLIFSELYILLQDENPLTAAKSSYHKTTGFSAELLPPLLFWGVLTLAGWQLGARMIDPQSPDSWLPLIPHQAMMTLLSMYGWALIYRLYQRYLNGEAQD